MKKFYRIDYKGTPRHAIEDGGTWRLLDGDLFGTHRAGDEIAPRRAPAARARRAVEDGLHRPQLQGSRGGAEQAAADVAADVHQAVDVGRRTGRGDRRSPSGIGRVDHEAEVGVVIGRRARHVSEADARGYVLGLTCFNDVTARELQQKGAQYTHAKGFDTFAPIGPCVAAGSTTRRRRRRRAGLGQRRASGRTRRPQQLVFSIDYLSPTSHA